MIPQTQNFLSNEKNTDTNHVSLLVVEDDPAMLIALRDILNGAGYQVISAGNGEEALKALESHKPALILSDIMMPIMDGIELFEAVRKQPYGSTIPFIFLTARGTREDIFAGKTLGVDDYITKPITSRELLAAVKSRLQRSGELAMMAQLLAVKDSLRVLANAIEHKRGHVERVNAFSQLIANELEWDNDRCNTLELSAILHDIGQIRLPDTVVLKPAALSDEEWQLIRKHPEIGANMIADIPYLAAAVPIVRHHHERWDGAGYPGQLKGTDIPLEARVLAVADTFDAMTSNRVYRDAIDTETARAEILSCSGGQFDPQIVEAFIRCWDRGEVLTVLTSDLGGIDVF